MKDRDVSSVGKARATAATASSLLEKLKTADPEGWSRLVRLYGPLVYGWCRQMGLQSQDAADVVQEVYRMVATAIPRFHRKQHASFRSWLKTITQNKVRDFWRQARREPTGTGGTEAQMRLAEVADVVAPDDDEVDEVTEQKEVDQIYRRVLELIRHEYTDTTWRAFVGVVVQSRRAADVAGDLGLSTNAVYIAKSRILSRIRREFGEFLE